MYIQVYEAKWVMCIYAYIFLFIFIFKAFFDTFVTLYSPYSKFTKSKNNNYQIFLHTN